MLLRVARGYRVPKPRVMTPNDWSLVNYRKLMRETRRRIHQEANMYQETIEQQFLEQRKQKMAQQHRDNEQKFRTQVIHTGHMLSKDLEKWRKEDEILDARLKNFVHKEQLKKLNRDRIIKIMNYESENFWFNEENLEERLVDTTIFPEEVGSTEYYHRLTEQSLAYEQLNFEKLEEIDSDEAAIKYKNKALVPLYSQIVTLLREVKSNPYRENEKQYSHAVNEINLLYDGELFAGQRKQKLEQATKKYEDTKAMLLEEMESQLKRDEFIKEKLLQIRKLLAYWKKYSEILNLTSTEIKMHNNYRTDLKNIEVQLSNFSRKLNAPGPKTTSGDSGVFQSAKEKNTSDEEVDLSEFYKEQTASDQPDMNQEKVSSHSVKLEKLDSILNSTELFQEEIPQKKKFPESIGAGVDEMTAKMNRPVPDLDIDAKDRFKDNTSVMIETWKSLTMDPQLHKLLDEVGEVSLDQAQLFWKVWETQ